MLGARNLNVFSKKMLLSPDVRYSITNIYSAALCGYFSSCLRRFSEANFRSNSESKNSTESHLDLAPAWHCFVQSGLTREQSCHESTFLKRPESINFEPRFAAYINKHGSEMPHTPFAVTRFNCTTNQFMIIFMDDGYATAPNGLRYLRVGGRGLCLGAEKTRSQKNACKSRRIPHVRCTLCWAAFWDTDITNDFRFIVQFP